MLQSVTKEFSGDYTCQATNTEGRSSSNAVTLRVRCKYIGNTFVSIELKVPSVGLGKWLGGVFISSTDRQNHSGPIFPFLTNILFLLFTQLNFLLPDAPVCTNGQSEVVGALKHETIMLKCEVDSSPPATSFHWTFNSSGEQTELLNRLQSTEVTDGPVLKR